MRSAIGNRLVTAPRYDPRVTGGEGEATARGDFRPDIQGLRALAVLAVLLYHAGVPFLPGGYVGVDMFFVISGFLITSHLLSGLHREGRVRFGAFYAKRARRILPASFVVLVLSVVAALIWFPPLWMQEVWEGAVATALYVPNYLFALQGTNYLAEDNPSLFQHYWSLGIEEQFYLVWPALLAFGYWVSRGRQWVLLGLVAALVLASFAGSVVLTSLSQPWAFFSLPTRAWELGIGGLVAFLLRWRPRPIPDWVAVGLAWAGLAALGVAVVLFSDQTPFPGVAAALPVLGTAALIVGGASGARFSPAPLLSIKPMLFVGAVSYSLYLVHWPALVIPQVAVGARFPLPLWLTLAIAVACVPVAWILYRVVETPARSMRWLVAARPSRTLWLAVLGSVGSIAIATGALFVSSARPLYVPISVPPLTEAVQPLPVATFVPQNVTPGLAEATDDQPEIYGGCHVGLAGTSAEGCEYGAAEGPLLVLFGDSHAAAWFPALEAAASLGDLRLHVFTKNACPSVSVSIERDGAPYRACDTWRENVFDRIAELNPDLVVLSNQGDANAIIGERSLEEVWAEGLEQSIGRIGAPVVILGDVPDLGDPAPPCLSAHLDDALSCAVTRAQGTDYPTRAAELDVSLATGTPYLDLTDWFCTVELCPAIIGNVLVYRDAHHLTATYSEMLGRPVLDALAPLL